MRSTRSGCRNLASATHSVRAASASKAGASWFAPRRAGSTPEKFERNDRGGQGMAMFPGFSTRTVSTPGGEVHLRVGGSGPPLLLLHGYPQTHAMWHAVAPALVDSFSVV